MLGSRVAAAAATVAAALLLPFASVASAGAIALDSTFGSGGVVQTSFAGVNADAGGAALDGLSRLVVVGAAGSPRHIVLARYLSNGALDSSFGSGGVVSTPIGVGSAASGIVVQGDGDIVVAGISFSTPTASAATVARYQADGRLDPGFGSGGIAVLPSVGREVTGVALYGAGKLVVAGAGQASEPGFSVARLTASGSLDPTFDGDGVARVHNDAGRCGRSNESGANSVLELPGGSILAAGLCSGRGGRPQTFGLVRFKGSSSADDEALDTSFASHGASVVSPVPGVPAFPVAIVRQPDGMLLEAGQSGIANGSGSKAVIVRREAGGALDAGFGVDGVRSFRLPGTDSSATGLALAPDGSIFASATVRPQGGFGLAQLTSDGMLAAGFGSGGTILTAVGQPSPKASEPASGTVGVLRQGDGKVLVVGNSRVAGHDAFTILRYAAPPSAGAGVGPLARPHALGSLRVSALTYDGRTIAGRLRCRSSASGSCRGRLSLAYGYAKLVLVHGKRQRRRVAVSLGSMSFSLKAHALGNVRIRPARKARLVLGGRRRVAVLATFANATTHERAAQHTGLTRIKRKR
ncbi:MAG TPA: hypothetical protein VFF79_12470 [Conexibacter sp.]|nr:hypothetical protein [Conexibacter sp.]